jgi:hypothetical protein
LGSRLARLLRRQERLDEADESYMAALDAVEELRGTLRLPAFKTDFFEDKVKLYEEVVGFLLEHRLGAGGAARSFHVAERSRARSFMDTLAESRAQLDDTLDVELLVKEREILAALSELQAKVRKGGETPELKVSVATREKELESLALRVRTTSPRFERLRYPRPSSLEEVRAALRHDERLEAYLLGDDASYAWSVKADGMTWRRLPKRAELEEQVTAAFGKLSRPGPDAAGGTPDLSSLGKTLLDPKAGGTVERLIIVPSGILHYLPFDALPSADGVLAQSATTTYVPSATALVELRARPAPRAGARLLAVGDAVYGEGASAERASLAGVASLGLLPHTRQEIDAVRSTFGRRATTRLTGSEATESRFKAQPLASYSVLHLATHGFVDASSPARSGIVFGPDKGGEDGILQVREIFRLKLDARLVTLSACQSALGKLATGEGMVGLSRAFLYAGADTIVASLWNVSDAATAELMSRFYSHLRSGDDKSEALRRARLDVRASPRWSHPYYWAPYVLIGRGEGTLPMPPDRSLLAGGGALIVLGALVGSWRRRAQRRADKVRSDQGDAAATRRS